MREGSPQDQDYVQTRLDEAASNIKDTLKPMREFFGALDPAKLPCDIRMRRGLSEVWLSDALAWLLDVKGEHGLGVRFAKSFLSRVAKLRSGVLRPREAPLKPYRRLKSMLKSGSSGSGTNPGKFNLANAAVFTEFAMIRKSKELRIENSMLADVVLFDLDLGDSLFVNIENKLFGHNHRGQLGSYYLLTEDKYKRATVREYVYLTLHGSEPIEHDKLLGAKKEDRPDSFYLNNWVRMSWLDDILPMLEKLHPYDPKEFTDLTELIAFLNWLKILTNPAANLAPAFDDLGQLIVSAVTDCLWWELNRIDGDSNSHWRIEKDKPAHRRRLFYTSLPKRPVNIHLWPPDGVAFSSKSDKRIRFERLVLRLGAHPSQMFNLIEIATRDLARRHFNDPTGHIEGGVRRAKTRNRFMKTYEPLFKFLHKHRLALPVLLHRALQAETVPTETEE